MSTHKEIEILLSLPRVEKYKKINDDWFIGYNKDIETSKKFYKKLHFLEIFLRNRIDVEISKIFSENWILPNENFPLSNKSAIRLKNIKFSTKKTLCQMPLLVFGRVFFTHQSTIYYGYQTILF
jgi:hypothetical protein